MYLKKIKYLSKRDLFYLTGDLFREPKSTIKFENFGEKNEGKYDR